MILNISNLLKYNYFLNLVLKNSNNKRIKKLIKKNFFLFLLNSIYTYRTMFSIDVINNKTYLVKLYNTINSKWQTIPKLNLLLKNNYFFWYFFNQDSLINLFVNFLTRKGKKHTSYKTFYQSLFFLKNKTGVHPLLFLKKILYKNRLLFDIKTLTLRSKVITTANLLSLRSQFTKSLRLILNNLSLSKLKIKNKQSSFYKKIIYLFLNNFFIKNRLKDLIKKESLIVKHNFINIKKENFFNKYVKQISNIIKGRLFKVKHKSLTKKMKSLKSSSNLINRLVLPIDINKKFLLDRYKINILSKNKLKTKWSV